MRTAVIYARVSSEGDRQSTARQVSELSNFAASAKLEVISIYEEKSGCAVRLDALSDRSLRKRKKLSYSALSRICA